jgi:hypothetical protein
MYGHDNIFFNKNEHTFIHSGLSLVVDYKQKKWQGYPRVLNRMQMRYLKYFRDDGILSKSTELYISSWNPHYCSLQLESTEARS